jgi:CHAT domain-containing protein
VHEIFGLDLRNTNLVVLSACETALSKIYGGDDLVGLSRGFIYAGTPSLLATLWEVDDHSTAILIEEFYKNWQKKGMSKPKALQQAQVALKSMPQYQHPFYWAPFIMIGDWR